MNKKAYLLFTFAILVLIVASTASAITGDSILRANVLKYEPLPAEPGDYLTVYIKVDNIAGRIAQDAAVKVVPEYPFTLRDPSQEIQSIGYFSGDQEAVLEFEFIVDSFAPTGTNNLEFQYTPNKYAGNWQKLNVDIDVRVSEINLDVENVRTEPKLIAGQLADLKFDISNMGYTPLKNIKVKAIFDDTPFTVVESTDELVFSSLASQSKQTASYKILVDGDADSGVYQIPMVITFVDDQGSSYTKSTTLGLVVDNKPDYVLAIEDSALYGPKKAYSSKPTDSIVLGVTNIGSSEIKAFSLELMKTDEYIVVSSSLMTPTNLDPDDFETQDFIIHVNKAVTTSKDIPLKVKVTYKDNFNREYEQIEELPLRLWAKKDAFSLGQAKKKSYLGLIILIIILGIVGYFIYNKYLKDKYFQKKKK